MKYIVYENHDLKEVNEEVYEEWLKNTAEQYSLPVYKIEIDTITYIIDTDYQGVFEDGMECCPFVLYYIERVKGDAEDNQKEEYYNTFEELNQRREELIKTI